MPSLLLSSSTGHAAFSATTSTTETVTDDDELEALDFRIEADSQVLVRVGSSSILLRHTFVFALVASSFFFMLLHSTI